MKRFAIVCALVLLLNVLCPVGYMHAEEISTPTDVECTHPRQYEVAYTWDSTHHWRVCPDCGEKLDVLEHNDKCYLADVCNDCDQTDVTFGFTGHGDIDMETYSSDEYTHWNVCVDCKAKINEYSHTGTVGENCTVCGALYVCAHRNGQYDFDDTYHWFVCSDCGITVEKTSHDQFANCTVCGYVCAHENKSSWLSSELTHWQECIDCGIALPEEAHYSTGNPGTCAVCWAGFIDCKGGSHSVDYSNIVKIDDAVHWFGCYYCGEPLANSSHGSQWCWDETNHWIGCSTCGYYSEGQFLGQHTVGCNAPTECTMCSYDKVTEGNLYHHADFSKYVYDEKEHWYACYCGEERSYIYTHEAFCDDPNTCGTCDAVLPEPMEVDHVASYEGADGFDETSHWWYCTLCGEIALKENHWAWCDWPNYCDRDECTNTTEIRHCGAMSDDDHDPETHALTCYCGDIYYEFTNEVTVKKATCSEDGLRTKRCPYCGEVLEETIPATGHTWGETVTVDATCTTAGSKTTTCATCGEKTVESIAATGKHTWGETVTVDATCTTDGSKTTACTVCGEKTVESIAATGKHTWGETVTVAATCAAAGSKTTACTVCGEKTVESIPAIENHAWETVNKVNATCTKAGRTERVCTVCDELSITTQGAKGHAYGLVFITEGNGTHAKTCADCGAKQVEACVLNSTEMGNMVCSACATCGYAVYTMTDTVLEEVAELTEAKAEIEVKRVENVSFEIVVEPAEEGAEDEAAAESAQTTDVVLVVHETQLEMTVELPDTVNASVKKVLAVSMFKEGDAIQPSSKVKLSIPVAEEEVSGMKLMLMGENGELIEIEYEIIDGVIVFETDMVGIFLFVEAEG